MNYFYHKNRCFYYLLIALSVSLSGCLSNATSNIKEQNSKQTENVTWQEVSAINQPTPRHEAGLVVINKDIYLLGGRRINPTNRFNVIDNTWTELNPTPIEIHHLQPVAYQNKIYIIGAMTGPFPNETPIDKVIVYDPQSDTYEFTHAIPKDRQRGGAGVVVYNDKFYIVGGITHGHMDGFKPWLDEYDPSTGEWKALQDAPHARDHFQAAVIDHKLYAFAGRTTSHATNQAMTLTVLKGDVYDFKKGEWEAVNESTNIPTKRAGNSVAVYNGHLIILGGESGEQVASHKEVEVYNPVNRTWSTLPNSLMGRHGTGAVIIDDTLYTASGSGNRGGGPELTSIEAIHLPSAWAQMH